MTLQQDAERTETEYLHKFADLANKRVLEIGCGEGRLTWQYAKQTDSVIGIDLDPDALRVAVIERTSDLQNKASFSQADSIHLPFSREIFDIALLSWSF